MVSTDPIADMLTRIRNAMAVNKPSINLPHSKKKEAVAKVLVKNGFLQNVATEKAGKVGKNLVITIMPEGGSATITEISKLSTPGRRIYVNADKIPTVKRGRGIVVISTSKGLMTGEEAKAKRLGGELVCQVY